MREATRSKWQHLVERQVRSGKSVRQFCSEEGLSPATVFWWRSKLRSRETSNLIPVTVVDPPSPQSHEVKSFELSIGNATLSIPHGFDAEELRRILQALSCTEAFTHRNAASRQNNDNNHHAYKSGTLGKICAI